MIIELSVLPVSEDEHVSKYVAEAVRIIDESGLDYQLTPMGTVISGDWDSVMAVAKACHEKMLSMTDRVITKIRIDQFKDQEVAPGDKVKAVEKVLGKEVKK